MKKHAAGPLLAVLFAVFVWGVSFVSTKVVLTELPPVSIAFFRQIVALVPLLVLTRVTGESLRVPKREILTFFVATLFGIVLYFVFENNGLQFTTASNASMLVAAIPVFALLTESIAERRRLPFLTLALVLVSIGGVYLVLFERGLPDLSSKTFLGNMLVFCAMVSWIIYTFMSRRLGKKYNSLKMTTVQSFCSLPLYLPFLAGEVGAWHVPSTTALLHLAFLGVFCSAGAYVAYLYGLQKLGPILPSAFLNLIPVVTILTGMVLLHEMPSWSQLIGASLIIGSLTVLTVRGAKTAVREEPVQPVDTTDAAS